MTDTRPVTAPEIAPFWQALVRVVSRRGRARAIFVQIDSFVNVDTQVYFHKVFILLAATRIFHTAALMYLDSDAALA
eukprot:795985-Lingulodinium_polyedra.AAC.1